MLWPLKMLQIHSDWTEIVLDSNGPGEKKAKHKNWDQMDVKHAAFNLEIEKKIGVENKTLDEIELIRSPLISLVFCFCFYFSRL